MRRGRKAAVPRGPCNGLAALFFISAATLALASAPFTLATAALFFISAATLALASAPFALAAASNAVASLSVDGGYLLAIGRLDGRACQR